VAVAELAADVEELDEEDVDAEPQPATTTAAAGTAASSHRRETVRLLREGFEVMPET
jgi:hypothetical protein